MDLGDPRSPVTSLGTLGLIAALLAGLALLPRLAREQEGGLVGHSAPDFGLAAVVNGDALGGSPGARRLDDLRGQAVLLDFWATWCGPCKVESSIVERISRRWRDRGLVVVGINTDTPDQGDPVRYVKSHGLTYPIVRDATGDVSRSYEVDGLPTLVVVSRTGQVVGVRSGVTDEGELERLLRQAL